MKKTLLFLIVLACCSAVFSQGSIGARGFVTGGGTYQNSAATVSHSLGNTFSQSVGGVSEGLQQTQTLNTRDTLLLLSTEAATAGYQPGYVEGNNDDFRTNANGYDEYVHHYVYSINCTDDIDSTMNTSGSSTLILTLMEPNVEPNEEEVSMVLSLNDVAITNPYPYPIGINRPKWTITYDTQSRTCSPLIVVHSSNCPDITSNDGSGFSYPVAKLGYYCWTALNSRAENYADASPVPNVMSHPNADVTTYGHLYSWDAATGFAGGNTNFTQGVCPDGWHIPTPTELEYLLTTYDALQLLSNTDWLPQSGTDDYGFHVLPAGYYNSETERYEGLLALAYFWTTGSTGIEYHACKFGAYCGTSEKVSHPGTMGYSVRCVQNY